jgi:hypothetical protein
MRFKLSEVGGAIGLLWIGIAAPLLGQQNATGFDTRKLVEFHGTVTKVEWINPHTWIHVAIKALNGTMEEWRIEAGTPNVLLRRGLTKESLSIGTEIIVDAYPLKNGLLVAKGRELTLPDGRKISIGSTSSDGKFVFSSKLTSGKSFWRFLAR